MENDINNLLVAASKILTEHKQETQSGKYFNCVDICGVGEIETRHSGIIAALLDPRGNHGFGAESLKAFFRQCNLANLSDHCEDCYVQTEVKIPGRRPDIVIQSKDLYVVIENKTNTCDHYMQLADYRDWVQEQKVTYKALLYLTYEGYKASDSNIKEGEYQSISYKETICNWLRECACMANTPAADFCRQYAEFIYKTMIPEGIMNNGITDKILENIESFKAADFINKSFDNARFQKLINLFRECWDGPEEITADNWTVNIAFSNKPYRITFQYNNNTPYFGISRGGKKSDFTQFKLEGWDEANAWWIAVKYIYEKELRGNWSNAEFLTEQWSKDNFASFKCSIKKYLNEVKITLEANAKIIDDYSNGISPGSEN